MADDSHVACKIQLYLDAMISCKIPPSHGRLETASHASLTRTSLTRTTASESAWSRPRVAPARRYHRALLMIRAPRQNARALDVLKLTECRRTVRLAW